jgi:hypothetical protein
LFLGRGGLAETTLNDEDVFDEEAPLSNDLGVRPDAGYLALGPGVSVFRSTKSHPLRPSSRTIHLSFRPPHSQPRPTLHRLQISVRILHRVLPPLPESKESSRVRRRSRRRLSPHGPERARNAPSSANHASLADGPAVLVSFDDASVVLTIAFGASRLIDWCGGVQGG